LKPKIELLIECGLTYQPLTIALSLLSEQYEIAKVHILTTHSAMQAVEKVVETFFPKQLYIIYGELVDANGTEHDQAEFLQNIQTAVNSLQNSAIAIIASGTNWMTWQFCNALKEYDTYVVKTAKPFEEKSFFPQYEKLAIAECGKIGENEQDVPIVYLQKLYTKPQKQKLAIDAKTIKFLGHEIELTTQLAAMYAYLIENNGMVDLGVEHTDIYNKFCELNSAFDNERALVDSFAARFRPNVSKINTIIEEHHELAQKHLVIERDGNRFFISGYELIF
jgi:hypothetical protein